MTYKNCCAALAIGLVFVSCSSYDGDEDPMKWRTDAQINRESYYSVVNLPATGADYSFTCTNYRGFHIERCKVNGASIGDVEGLDKIEGIWYTIEKKDNSFRIVVQSNKTENTREISFDAWSGNASTLFLFRQSHDR